MAGSTYNPYPSPRGGQGPYGLVPGPVPMPNPSADLFAQFGALPAANKAAGTDILAELGGNVSPGTRNALKLASAQFGQGSGMGLSGLSDNQLFGNIAGFAEGQVQKGMQNYNQIVPTISQTQTVPPALQADIAAHNATLAAAPDPAQSNALAQKLFDQYLSGLRGPAGGAGGGPAAGTGAYQNSFAVDRLGNPPAIRGAVAPGQGFDVQPSTGPTYGPGPGWSQPTTPGTQFTGPGSLLPFNDIYNMLYGGGLGTTPGAAFGTTPGASFGTTPGGNTADWTTSDPFGVGGFPGGGDTTSGQFLNLDLPAQAPSNPMYADEWF